MAEDTDGHIDCALEGMLNATNQSKHFKSELKKTIMESVSTVRNIFYALKQEIVDKLTQNKEL
jgi:acetylglutamate kinase